MLKETYKINKETRELMKLQLMSIGLPDHEVEKYLNPFNTIVGSQLFIDSRIKILRRKR